MNKPKRPSRSRMIGDILELWNGGKIGMIGEAISSCGIEGIGHDSTLRIYNATVSLDMTAFEEFTDKELKEFWEGFCNE